MCPLDSQLASLDVAAADSANPGLYGIKGSGLRDDDSGLGAAFNPSYKNFLVRKTTVNGVLDCLMTLHPKISLHDHRTCLSSAVIHFPGSHKTLTQMSQHSFTRTMTQATFNILQSGAAHSSQLIHGQ